MGEWGWGLGLGWGLGWGWGRGAGGAGAGAVGGSHCRRRVADLVRKLYAFRYWKEDVSDRLFSAAAAIALEAEFGWVAAAPPGGEEAAAGRGLQGEIAARGEVGSTLAGDGAAAAAGGGSAAAAGAHQLRRCCVVRTPAPRPLPALWPALGRCS